MHYCAFAKALKDLKLLSSYQNINHTKWRELLSSSPYASPFQSPEMYELYQAIDGIGAEVFAVESNGQYQALMVISLQHEKGLSAFFSRRGIVYGGPLLRSDKEIEALSLLMRTVKQKFKHKLIYLELRNGFEYKPLQSTFATLGFQYIPWLNYQFRALDKNHFMEGMAKSRLRQLKKALNNGVTWRLAESEKDLKAFYAILSQLYREKVKKPLPSFEFFSKFHQSTIAKVLLVQKDEDIIGGVMCPFLAGHFIYEYYICGLDRQYPEYYPSTMAMWAMVSYAEELGIENVDLMGAGEPDKANSVRDFKKKFGGELLEHGRYLMVFNSFLYHLGRFAILRWNKIKSYL